MMNEWLAARNILAVRMDNMGDVVMLGPALRAVKRTSPGTRITLLASPAGAQVASLLLEVDDAIVWRAIWQDVGNRMPLDPGRELELVRLLAERRFDAALIFTSFSQNPHLPGYVCYLAGIPLRAGESKEFGGSALTTALRGCPDEMHQAERNLRLVEHLGFQTGDRQLAIRLGDEVRARVPELLRDAGIAPDAPYMLLHPGASCEARRYPAERYTEVARLLDARGHRVIVAGAEREAEIVRTAARGIPAERALLGKTSVAELAALIERAALVICNDTLTLHLADAVRTPLVVLYSGTEYDEQWRPRAVRHRLLRRPTDCQPCYRFTCPIGLPCLDIPPKEVVAAAEELLALGEETANAENAEARGERGEEENFTTEGTEGTDDRSEGEERGTAEDAEREIASAARAGGLRGRRPLGADASTGPVARAHAPAGRALPLARAGETCLAPTAGNTPSNNMASAASSRPAPGAAASHSNRRRNGRGGAR
ncbi:MAG TPA: glycosyltransferase family 9 protein [Ktedonobacterales bacterium]